ncbi:glycerol kinase [Limosa lapponica baueri]|uniref:Glycerol kinase n=1 Tax=Limosa lapponica baueri TaxID=1758121 RepID=A0A2I0TZ14_LIMLA|nr:glycerol kinase [Limosa lapponica baueri]
MYSELTYFDVISYALPLILKPLSDDVHNSPVMPHVYGSKMFPLDGRPVKENKRTFNEKRSSNSIYGYEKALLLMEDFNHPDICWEGHTARHVLSTTYLLCIDDNFLTQVVKEPTRRGVLLDVVLANEEGLMEDVKVGGSLGCSDHEKIEFRIMGSMRKTPSRIATLDFRRADFDLFKKLLGEFPWVRDLEGVVVTEDAEKLLNAFFASVFTDQASPQESQT